VGVDLADRLFNWVAGDPRGGGHVYKQRRPVVLSPDEVARLLDAASSPDGEPSIQPAGRRGVAADERD
jgi:hypothetical protein